MEVDVKDDSIFKYEEKKEETIINMMTSWQSLICWNDKLNISKIEITDNVKKIADSLMTKADDVAKENTSSEKDGSQNSVSKMRLLLNLAAMTSAEEATCYKE